jgi:hypothetical protein
MPLVMNRRAHFVVAIAGLDVVVPFVVLALSLHQVLKDLIHRAAAVEMARPLVSMNQTARIKIQSSIRFRICRSSITTLLTND